MIDNYVSTVILETMRLHNSGRENAEPRERIERRLGHRGIDLCDRRVRAAYSKIPLCSCNDGLFIPIRPEEVTEYERYSLMTRPPAEVAIKVRRIYATWPLLKPRPVNVQASLFPQPEAWR
jgi:hypothetical protein